MCFFCTFSVKFRLSTVNFTHVLVKFVLHSVGIYIQKSAKIHRLYRKSEVFMLSKYASVGSRPFLYVKGFYLPRFLFFFWIYNTYMCQKCLKSHLILSLAHDKFYQRRIYFRVRPLYSSLLTNMSYLWFLVHKNPGKH